MPEPAIPLISVAFYNATILPENNSQHKKEVHPPRSFPGNYLHYVSV